MEKSIEKLGKCTDVKVGKCMKELVKSVYLLNFLKNHPLISLLFSDLPKNECVGHREVSFKANHHAVPKNSVRYNECPL